MTTSIDPVLLSVLANAFEGPAGEYVRREFSAPLRRRLP